MKDIRKELTDIRNKIDDCVVALIMDTDDVVESTVKPLTGDISYIFQSFISDAGELAAMGVELPVDVIVSQLKRYMSAADMYDTIALADVLKYEIMDTVSVYMDIQEELYG